MRQRRSSHLILGSLACPRRPCASTDIPGCLRWLPRSNGDDFVPFNEALFTKEPGLGASAALASGRVTHWEQPHRDAGSHVGFKFFMAQLEWPHARPMVSGSCRGSHKTGKADIRAMVAASGLGTAGRARLLPVVLAGDVATTNRQCVHGSFRQHQPGLASERRSSASTGAARRRCWAYGPRAGCMAPRGLN
jgi:hypothetical protein